MAQEIQTVMTPDPAAVDVNAALVDAASAMHDRDSVLGEISAAEPNR